MTGNYVPTFITLLFHEGRRRDEVRHLPAGQLFTTAWLMLGVGWEPLYFADTRPEENSYIRVFWLHGTRRHRGMQHLCYGDWPPQQARLDPTVFVWGT